MRGKQRVAIAIPSGDMVHADFCRVACLADARRRDFELILVNVKFSVIASARNHLIAAARNQGCHAILFLDFDMVFPARTLSRPTARDKDIVGGVYRRRSPPNDFLGATLDSGPRAYTSGLVEMALMPTGCLLVRMAVFERFDAPIFKYVVNPATREHDSEDYVFCRQARALGFEVWCDIDLSKEVGHIGQHVWRLEAGEGLPRPR